MNEVSWSFWIDRGGTFTDVVAVSGEGEQRTMKLLSADPSYEDAATEAVRRILGTSPGEPIPSERIVEVRMGTTVATNALLERTGEATVLVITKGFADALRIGDQHRPKIFSLHIERPAQLAVQIIEVDERVRADGTVERPLDLDRAITELRAAHADGLRSVAIVLMHGDRYPDHERRLADASSEIGFTQVSVSHDVSSLPRLVPRGDTTVVDAYLSPVLDRYIAGVATELGDVPLRFMQSNGGLADADDFRGRDAIVSGPAGGVVGMAAVAEAAGFGRAIGFDMGGTSTDVSLYGGRFERTLDTVVAGVRVRAPMLDIHTVAAGGGSVLHFDGARYRVGPDSAGADPGPACYRRGGPLTLTDADVVLGRVRSDEFPAVFGPDGDQRLDAEASARRCAELAEQIGQASGTTPTIEEVAAGFVEIAVENMVNAIRKISIERGHDVTSYALVSFGGAGGQHACAIADALEIETVIVHPLAGVLSAYGMGLAQRRTLRERAVERPLDAAETAEAVTAALDDLEADARTALAGGDRDDVETPEPSEDRVADRGQIEVERRVHLRYAGTDTALDVPEGGEPDALRAAFEDAYRQRFSFLPSDRPLVVEAVTVEAIDATPAPRPASGAAPSDLAANALSHDKRRDRALSVTQNGGRPEGPSVSHDKGRDPTSVVTQSAGTTGERATGARLHVGGARADAEVRHRDEVRSDQVIVGPAVVVESTATTVIDPGWSARVDDDGTLLLRRSEPRSTRVADGIDGTAVDPIRLEVFANRFMAVAEQMGTLLAGSAQSVNIKERLDFSCALFDAGGGLVANAPHIPVHLGSMGESVRHVLAANADTLRPGDVYVLNDPYHGGTHLPDITVVTPVYAPACDERWFVVASRGHHADIGGISPGSMPPDSRRIDDEGVRLDNVLLVRDGSFREAELGRLLNSGPYPARNVDQNLGDLRAQVAANAAGVEGLRAMVDEFGLDVVQAFMGHVQANATEAVRQVIDRLDNGECSYEMDNGAEICVAVRIDRARRSVTIDFTGTSPQREDNFNAPTSVTRAAVLYVFRTLVAADIPLNEGCLVPIDIVIPAGSMLDPSPPAAVVAGNVETSQCVVGALYRALGAVGESQGTMNNVTFGNDRHQYYETVAGGSGAGDGFDGEPCVQTHMTNSRLTDPEILESRYPVLVESFTIRHGSGGGGRWRGGDGAVRRIRFDEAMRVSLLSTHRRIAPYGMAGGDDGAAGSARIERADGSVTGLGATDAGDVAPGDVLVVETPGGGGYGPP